MQKVRLNFSIKNLNVYLKLCRVLSIKTVPRRKRLTDVPLYTVARLQLSPKPRS